MSDNKIHRLLEEKFSQLERDKSENSPSHLKEEVFRTLEILDLVGDISALFTVDLGRTAAEFIDLLELNVEEE